MRYDRGLLHIYFVFYPVLQTPFENPAILAGDAEILRNCFPKPGSAPVTMVRAGLLFNLVII